MLQFVNLNFFRQLSVNLEFRRNKLFVSLHDVWKTQEWSEGTRVKLFGSWPVDVHAVSVTVVYYVSARVHWVKGATDQSTHIWTMLLLGTVFVTFLFRTSFIWEVPRALRDCTRSCEFRRNSSSFNQARRIRLSEQLNSWARFLLTLPSMFLETCVICSSLIVETFVLRDKLFLGCFFWLSLDCRYFPFVSKSNHLNAGFKTEFTLLAYLPGEKEPTS